MSKPTKKEIKELQDHIHSLNSIILDCKEQNLAIGNERNKWQSIAKRLWEHLSDLDKVIISDSIKDDIRLIESGEQKKQVTTPNVSKSFTYKDISKVAEELANNYCSDKKDPVWQDIKKDGIKAIQAFVSKHL